MIFSPFQLVICHSIHRSECRKNISDFLFTISVRFDHRHVCATRKLPVVVRTKKSSRIGSGVRTRKKKFE